MRRSLVLLLAQLLFATHAEAAAEDPCRGSDRVECLEKQVAEARETVGTLLAGHRIQNKDLVLEADSEILADLIGKIGQVSWEVPYRNTSSGGHIWRKRNIRVKERKVLGRVVFYIECTPRIDLDGAGTLQGTAHLPRIEVTSNRPPIRLSASTDGLRLPDLRARLEIGVDCHEWDVLTGRKRVYGDNKDFWIDAELLARDLPMRLDLEAGAQDDSVSVQASILEGSLALLLWRVTPPAPPEIPSDWWREIHRAIPIRHPLLLRFCSKDRNPNCIGLDSDLDLADLKLFEKEGCIRVVRTPGAETPLRRDYELRNVELSTSTDRGFYVVSGRVDAIVWGPWVEETEDDPQSCG